MRKECFAEKFFHFAHLLLENYEDLGLSAEDAKKILELKIGIKKNLIRDMAEIEVLAVDILVKLYDDKPELSDIYKLLEKKYDIKKEGAKKLAAAFVEIKKLLSKEQMKKAKTLCKGQSQAQPSEAQCCK